MLEALPGIGPWTSNVYLLFALRRPDIWPPGDLALHKAIAKMRRLADIPSSDEAAHLALRWQPYRSVAARVLWHGYLTERGRS
jgi:DNA-3-methyladenine glycosylase II